MTDLVEFLALVALALTPAVALTVGFRCLSGMLWRWGIRSLRREAKTPEQVAQVEALCAAREVLKARKRVAKSERLAG